LPDHLLLFDGVCNLCNGLVQFVIKHDKKKKFRFASLQSAAGQQVLNRFHLPLKDFDSFVYIKNNMVLIKSNAALNVFRETDGAWKLFYALTVIPRPLRDWVYNLIARHRYK